LRICQRCGYRLYEVDAELVLAKANLSQENIDKAKPLAQSAYEKANSMNYHLFKTEANLLMQNHRLNS